MLKSLYSYRFLLGFLCLSYYSLAAASTPLDSVVAIVNEGVITQSQLDNATKALKFEKEKHNEIVPSDVELKKQAMDNLIAQTLQLQIANRAKIKVSDEQVTQSIFKIANQNHMTIQQLQEALANEGIKYERFRTQIRDQILTHTLQQQALAGKVNITDEEVKEFMRHAPQVPASDIHYHLEDLRIPASEAPTASELDSIQKETEALLEKAKKGESLSKLAQENNHTGSSLEYYDLGWRMAIELPSIFTGPITKMTQGSVAGPIQAPNGFHIIRLIGIQGEAHPLTKNEAKTLLMQKKFNEQVDEWMQKIRKSSYIKIM